jgi:hypothetical protein
MGTLIFVKMSDSIHIGLASGSVQYSSSQISKSVPTDEYQGSSTYNCGLKVAQFRYWAKFCILKKTSKATNCLRKLNTSSMMAAVNWTWFVSGMEGWCSGNWMQNAAVCRG